MVKLYDYQVRAREALRDAYRRGVRSVILVSPTGSGKTTIAADLILGALAKGSPCLFLAHRKELIDQCVNRLYTFGVVAGVIMAGVPESRSHAVQVASVASLRRREKPPARLVVVDEAHHADAGTYREILACYPDAMIVGLTATPERADGRGLGDLFDELVEAETIGGLTNRWVETGGREGLVQARCFAPPHPPDMKAVRIRGGDYDKAGMHMAMAKPQLVGDIVETWRTRGEGRKAVVFCTSVEHSLMVVERFRDAGVSVGHVDGTTDKAERARILADLARGEIQVVTNCMVLTEGWDMPDLGCVILARPTMSLSLYLQMVGRGLRAAPGKLDCVVLDMASCLYMHGLPNEDREWALKVTKGKRREAKLRQCKVCFLYRKPTIRQCPAGCVEPFDPREMIREVDGELVEFGADGAAKPRAWWPEWLALPAKRVMEIPAGSEEMRALQRSTYDRLALDWMRDCRRGKRRAVGWVGVKYREVFGVWPSNAIKAASPHADDIKAGARPELEGV